MLKWFIDLFKGAKRSRESFDSFMFYETINNPSLNLDDALNRYMKKHSLMIRVRLDEPECISVLRTKLQIVEEVLTLEPDFCKQKELRDYVANLRRFTSVFDTLPSEGLKRMKERMS